MSTAGVAVAVATRARARGVEWLLVGLVVALALPYAISGPKLILDDWFFLRNAHFDGAFSAGGARQLDGRPGAWLLYALQFGVIGRRPMALYALQTLANAAVAVALFAAARRFLARHVALAVTVVWVLLPNHASLSRWFSTLPAVVALLLLLLGVIALDGRRPAAGIGLFVVAALCYEAVIPVAMFALVAVAVVRRRRLGADVLTGLLLLALLTQWAWMHRLYPDVEQKNLGALFPIHFGPGVTAWSGAGLVLALVAAVGLTVGLYRRDRLVLGGLVIIAVGSAAFFRWPWTVTGINDRANVVGSIGAALAWVGIGLMLRRIDRRAVVAGALVAAAVVVPAHLERDRDYRRAGDDAQCVLAEARSAPVGPGGDVLLTASNVRSHHEVYGFFDWLAPHAAQLARDDATVTARFVRRR